MQQPSIRVVGVYLPRLDVARYNAFVKDYIDSQNPINFSDELKSFMVRVGRGSEIVALPAEELQQRKEYFEQVFSGVAQIEVLVDNPDEQFSVADFEQGDPSIPRNQWQVAWRERFLTEDGQALLGEYWSNKLPEAPVFRVVFFIHLWRQDLGLNSTYGSLVLVPPTPVPERLWQLAPFELVD